MAEANYRRLFERLKKLMQVSGELLEADHLWQGKEYIIRFKTFTYDDENIFIQGYKVYLKRKCIGGIDFNGDVSIFGSEESNKKFASIVKILQSLATRLAKMQMESPNESGQESSPENNQNFKSEDLEQDENQGVDPESQGEKTTNSSSDHHEPLGNDPSEPMSDQKSGDSEENNSNSENSKPEQLGEENFEKKSSESGNTSHNGDAEPPSGDFGKTQSDLTSQNMDGSEDEDETMLGDSEPLFLESSDSDYENKSESENSFRMSGDKEQSENQESLKEGEAELNSFHEDFDLQESTENSNQEETPCVNLSTDGFFKMIKNLGDSKSVGGGGGGAQLNTKEHGVQVHPRIAESLARVAGGKSFALKQDGSDRWDGRKLVKAISSAPQKIVLAKYERPPAKTYFFVDTSGSVSQFGYFIITMIKSALQNNSIEVWSGSEAHPQKNERTNQDKISYIQDFAENLQAWIKMENPEIGSTLVFWGDLQDAHINPIKLKKASRDYRCIWLHCEDKNVLNGQWERSEARQVKEAGFTVVNAVNSVTSLVKGLYNIQ